MEKWEKMMNSKKETVQNNMKKFEPEVKQAAADTAFAMFTDTSSSYSGLPLDKVMYKNDDLVAAYSGDSDEDIDSVIILTPPQSKSPSTLLKEEEEKLINWDKIACHLCNRGFKDKSMLEKHRSISDLHRKNIEQLREKLGIPDNLSSSAMSIPMKSIKYRDRAKERREKFGIPSPPTKRKYESDLPEIPLPEAPAVPAVAQPEVKVSRMMEKMGWTQGQGLGKSNQGRTEIVQAEFHTSGAGIGAAPKFNSAPSDSYRENLKRAMYAKYHDA
uniref:RNA binding motif protein n=1 Tax=Dugesia japonica TaxID=6161 RepID=A4V6L2_DUGJA|nr:RNA binding motif protein [Dugesia japonica]